MPRQVTGTGSVRLRLAADASWIQSEGSKPRNAGAAEIAVGDRRWNQCGKVGSRSISRVLSWTAIPLGVPLPARSSSLPGSSASHAQASLFGLAPDGVCRAVRVTTAAVSSYLAVSPLPALGLSRTSAVCFLLHFPSPHGARSLTGILLCGARTFLSARGLHLLPSGCLTDFPADYTPGARRPGRNCHWSS
jgi:hypothetical protein